MRSLVITKHKEPHCFKQISNDYAKLRVDYRFSSSAWMNSKIFNEWLDSWNADLIKMNRKILHVMENFSGHLKYTDKCSNIELLFLSPNTASKSKPLDAGIIKAFKDEYKKLFHDYLYEKLISNDSDLAGVLKSYSLLDAIKNVNEA